MSNFWLWLTNLLDFTGVNDRTVWQDILVSAILLPLFFLATQRVFIFLDRNRPTKVLLKGYLKKGGRVLIFLSQLKAVDGSGNKLANPQYINEFPAPLPTDRSRLETHRKQNIDPVWSEGDGECLASVYNILGRAEKVSDIEIADTIKDWSRHSQPIISIGFNPKTLDLEKRCTNLDYVLERDTASISMPVIDKKVDAYLPNDGGVIQKTFLKSTGQPVLILAGLGTVGTSAAGFVLSQEVRSIGKLYADKSFCMLFKADTNIGRSSGELQFIYPAPSFWRKISHFITYSDYRRRGVFADAM